MKRFLSFCHLLYFVFCFHFNEALQLLNLFGRSRSGFRDQIDRYQEQNVYGGIPGQRSPWSNNRVPPLPMLGNAQPWTSGRAIPGALPGSFPSSFPGSFPGNSQFDMNGMDGMNFDGQYGVLPSGFNGGIQDGFMPGSRRYSRGRYPAFPGYTGNRGYGGNDRCFTANEVAGLLDEQSQMNPGPMGGSSFEFESGL